MDAPEGFTRELGPGGLETRTLPVEIAGLTARAANDDTAPHIAGFGSVYGQSTTIAGWFSEWDEEVAPGAWAKSVAEGDVRSMMNHDVNWLLGRTSSKTLTLEDRDEGLWYDVEISPNDPNAMSVHAKVERGDISGSSVWFRVVSQKWEYPDEDNDLERPKRTILEARLFEVGPVVFPAFPQTSVTARSLDGVLRAAGVTNDARRAEVAFDLLTDPNSVEHRIRELFTRQPDLRKTLCDTRAAAGAPAPADPPTDTASADGSPEGPPQPHPAVAVRRRHLHLVERRNYP